MGKDISSRNYSARVLVRRPLRAGLAQPSALLHRDTTGLATNTSKRSLDRDLHEEHLNNIVRLKAMRSAAAVRLLKARLPRTETQYRAHPDMLRMRPPSFWLRHQAAPLDQMGRSALILMADPTKRSQLQTELGDHFCDIIALKAPREKIEQSLLNQFTPLMTKSAAHSVPPAMSCRSFDFHRARIPAMIVVLSVCVVALLAPFEVLLGFSALTLVTLLMFSLLRASGLSAAARARSNPAPPPKRHATPMISVLVPLYREAEITRHLLRRLCRITYPRNRLEVLLVVEENDTITQNAVRCADLPKWFRVVEVPQDGPLTTKPRAMNYALNFCRGEIIGIWDAEDAPAPHQLNTVAAAFETAPPDVVCYQGVLDFYNTNHNWISRCFTLEYAGWFRVLLQGIAKMGLVVPLGGTTVFIRRCALEKLGGWDAHNVTEDADLGVRIARAGLRTEMLPTTTHEEANSRILPWIKQRSRWLKGFMMTYLVHMRRPIRLFRDLGLKRFLGFQAFFLGTLGQFLLAPILWSFWLIALGLPHPADHTASGWMFGVAAATLVMFELLNLCVWILGARASGRPWLALWAPLMPLYFVMGCLAAYKALAEVFIAPFFWDKTSHGHHGNQDAGAS